jgi:hypothetical protein
MVNREEDPSGLVLSRQPRVHATIGLADIPKPRRRVSKSSVTSLRDDGAVKKARLRRRLCIQVVFRGDKDVEFVGDRRDCRFQAAL